MLLCQRVCEPFIVVSLHLRRRITVLIFISRKEGEEREVIEDCSEPTAFTARVLRQNYLSIYLSMIDLVIFVDYNH